MKKENHKEIYSKTYSNTKSKTSISTSITKYLRRSNADSKLITRDELALRMETSWEVIKKKLNRNRPISRDYLIALSIQLRLSIDQTNEVLSANNENKLTEEKECEVYDTIDRDTLLRYIIEDSHYYVIKKNNDSISKKNNRPKSLNEINKDLVIQDCAPLDFFKANIVLERPYKILNKRITTNIDGLVYNPSNSLEYKYNLDFCTWVSEMELEDKKTSEKIRLSLTNENNPSLIEETKTFPVKPRNQRYKISDFESYFAQLKTMNFINKIDNYRLLDDTKNFGIRSSAKFIDNHLVLFAEQFNYKIPQKNEYFFLLYEEGKFTFSTSNKSQFLYYQLGSEKYEENTNQKFSISSLSSPTFQELLKDYNKKKSYHNPNKYLNYNDERLIKYYFLELKKEIDNLINNLAEKKIFIRNSEDIFYHFGYQSPQIDYQIVRFFNAEKYFGSKRETIKLESSENILYEKWIFPIKENIIFENVNLNLTDLKDSYELGLNTLNEIKNVKIKYGLIQGMFNNLLESYKNTNFDIDKKN